MISSSIVVEAPEENPAACMTSVLELAEELPKT